MRAVPGGEIGADLLRTATRSADLPNDGIGLVCGVRVMH
jgi:hypothetical protein